jgi:hypothetical protein
VIFTLLGAHSFNVGFLGTLREARNPAPRRSHRLPPTRRDDENSQLLLAEASELAAPKESGATIGWLTAALALMFRAPT